MEFPQDHHPATTAHEDESPHKPAPSLTELFPDDHRDLDDLFPEAKFRELFKDVVVGLADVSNFVSRMDQELFSEKKTGASKSRPAGGARAPRLPQKKSAPKGARPGSDPWKRT